MDTKKNKLMLFSVIIIALYGFFELVGFIGLYMVKKWYKPVAAISQRHTGIINNLLQDTAGYISFSKELGWTIRESAKTEWYTANSAGIRSTREYSFFPDTGTTRILVCGDGFVHCNDVKDHKAWPALLEQNNANWEVLNFGVWGHSLDQIYLRYLEKGTQYKSHIVLIGVGTDNMFRLVNTYRPFMFRNTGLPFAKPRFILQNDSLLLIKNPLQHLTGYEKLLNHPEHMLPILGENDYYYHKLHFSMDCYSPSIKLIKTMAYKINERRIQAIPFIGEYNENVQALRIMLKLIDTFHENVSTSKSSAVFCIFPLAHDVIQFKKTGTKRYNPLLLHCQTKDYHYIDVIHAFDHLNEVCTIQDQYLDFYSVAGNELVASYIEQSIKNIIAIKKTTTGSQLQ